MVLIKIIFKLNITLATCAETIIHVCGTDIHVKTSNFFYSKDRPEFKELLHTLEECRQSQAVALLSNSEVPSVSFPAIVPNEARDSDSESDGRTTPPLAVNVTALRTHWESEATRNRYDLILAILLVFICK